MNHCYHMDHIDQVVPKNCRLNSMRHCDVVETIYFFMRGLDLPMVKTIEPIGLLIGTGGIKIVQLSLVMSEAKTTAQWDYWNLSYWAHGAGVSTWVTRRLPEDTRWMAVLHTILAHYSRREKILLERKLKDRLLQHFKDANKEKQAEA